MSPRGGYRWYRAGTQERSSSTLCGLDPFSTLLNALLEVHTMKTVVAFMCTCKCAGMAQTPSLALWEFPHPIG